MKNILENLISTDTSYNKSATRYLSKTHPELWSQILELTIFLPNDAKPKQRVWHILNENYTIQLCPITNEPLKWNEKDYKKFSSISAKNKGIGKIISASTTDNHWRKKNPEKSKQANKKFSEGFHLGNHKPWEERNRDYVSSIAAAKKTWLEKYGVDNPSKHPKIKQQLSTITKKRYGLNSENTELSKLYYNAVKLETNNSWYKNFYKINGEGSNRRSKDMHLDHIYSIREGFKNNIPAYIIGHWTNLRLISKVENSSKGSVCHKTSDQLFEDFFNNQG